jgi:hypothetical protein
LRSGELAFDFLDAAFDEALAVFGGVVFGVFAQVTLRARFGNGADDFGAVFGFEAVQLGLELFGAALVIGMVAMVVCVFFVSCKSKPPRRTPAASGCGDYAESLRRR